jgi:hypothetical protein
MTDREAREAGAATFEALDDESEVVLGPPAVLLIGFDRAEGARIEGLLHELVAGDYRVVCCTTTMGTLRVAEALGGADGGTLLPVGKVPRIALLSGLGDRQVGAVLDRYGTTGLPRPIFAVATEANLRATVIRLMEELVAERRELG